MIRLTGRFATTSGISRGVRSSAVLVHHLDWHSATGLPGGRRRVTAAGCKTCEMAEDVAWWPSRDAETGTGRVAVVTVSYNTRELTALLLWSLWRVLEWNPPPEIVVVDNGSRDGSAELLAGVEASGLCFLLANCVNRHHGLALNQALSWFALRPDPHPDWVWVLDSDCVVARGDVLTEATSAAEQARAAVVGESHWDPWHRTERFETYSLLLDPARVWQPGTTPFQDGGDPSFELLESLGRRDVGFVSFSFTAEGYIIHRGRGSLAAVLATGDRSNPLYEWAVDHHAAHFGQVPGAAQRYRALVTTFRRDVGRLTATSLAAACHRGTLDPLADH
jgi:hypothetical protein